jgi:hypothetical protein
MVAFVFAEVILQPSKSVPSRAQCSQEPLREFVLDPAVRGCVDHFDIRNEFSQRSLHGLLVIGADCSRVRANAHDERRSGPGCEARSSPSPGTPPLVNTPLMRSGQSATIKAIRSSCAFALTRLQSAPIPGRCIIQPPFENSSSTQL